MFLAVEQLKEGIKDAQSFPVILLTMQSQEKSIQELAISLYLKKNLLKYWRQPRFQRQLNFIGRVWEQSGFTHCFLPSPALGGGGEARFATSGMLRYKQSGDTTWPRIKLH